MPTIDIPDRICPHCGGTRWYVCYENNPLKKDPNNKKLKYKCNKKKLEKDARARKRKMVSLSEEERKSFNRKRYERYKDQVSLKQKEKRRVYRLNNPIIKKQKSEEEKKIESRLRTKEWYRLNKDKPEYIEKRRKKDKLNEEKNGQNLPNFYIRKLLKRNLKISPEIITGDCINKYRTYLLALRQLKQLENERKSKIS